MTAYRDHFTGPVGHLYGLPDDAPALLVEPATPAEPQRPRWLTIAEAADEVPLSPKQLYRVAGRTGSPFRKVERRWLVDADDLHRWVRSHSCGADEPTPRERDDGLAARVRRRREDAAR